MAVQKQLPPCVFEDGMLAVARFRLNKGCIARRFDNDVQDLCMQHIVSATPIDQMELEEEYIPGILESME